MVKAAATGANTLVITYSKPTSDVLANLQQLPILPEHVWGKYAVGNGAGLKTFPNKPTPGHPVVSGGPFMCTSFVLNQDAIFLTNKNFYGPKPHISGFGLQVFSNDDAMVQALKSGQIDAIENVPVTSVKAVKAAGFHVYVGPSLTWRDLIINPVQGKTSDRELLNPLVRKAFEYAIDRESIVKTAWLGYATPAASAIPPATGIWHDPAIHPLPFNINMANQLLNQAGFKKGSNGIRNANGHPMSYQVIFSSDQDGPGDRAFSIIQTDFQKIGVKLTQEVMDPAATETAITANHYRNYNLAMWFWVPLIDPSLMLSAYTCSQYDSWNDSGLCTPALDKLYEEQSSALSLAQRVKLVYQAQEIIYNSRAEIALVNNDVIDAWNKQWTGFVETPQGFFNQFSKIDLEQVRLK
jgi:peptide/nickel transport system substrate-binding protein